MPTLRRLIVAAALAALVLGLAPAYAHASTSDQLERTRQQLAQARARIAAARQQKASLGDQIADLDSRLSGLDTQLAKLKDQIAGVTEKLDVTKKKLELLREQLELKKAQLARAEKRLEVEQDNFEQRVVLSYKSDDLDYIDVVFASSSFEELVSSLHLARELIGGDNELVGDLETTRDEVRSEKQTIAVKEQAVDDAVADLQKQSDQLAALQAQQAAQREQALAMRQQKSSKMSSVSDNIAELEHQESVLAAESNALAGIIAGNSGQGHGTGSMIWPVSGSITSSFGWRIHPITGKRTFHSGIDIGAAYGTPIKAADGGRVIYATWVDGYGNTIAIDHGKGISTLYAHQSSMAVGYGATVTRGQVIGYVGSTGFSTGPHLHFEVRVNGSPVNPLSYLP